MQDIVIVGSSGFADEIHWLIDRMNKVSQSYSFLGFIDKEPGEKVIGDDDWLINYDKKLAVVIAIGDGTLRSKLVAKYRANTNLFFPNVIDPSVIMSDSVEMGEGNIICASTIITTGITLGSFDIFNLDCTIGHDTIVDDFVTLNPSCNVSGNCNIGRCSNIGTGTQIIQGLLLGDNTIVGAGAVVSKDLPGNCTAVGVPAKVIKSY